MVMTGTYDYRLVALSVCIAILAAYAALDLSGRVKAAPGKWRAAWLAGGATAMGLGIWAMHYVGMLAFVPPMPVFYHVPTVVYSLLSAIAAAAIALSSTSRRHLHKKALILGGCAMGGAIAAMHYIGMDAMRMKARIEYDWTLVAVSIGLAVVISWVALWLSFNVREERPLSPRKLLSAVVMGSAIPIMHYTGMASARFIDSDHVPDLHRTVGISTLGVSAISGVTLVVLALVIASAFLDRHIQAQQDLMRTLQESETNFRSLAEAIPQIVWSAGPDGLIRYSNRKDQEISAEGSNAVGWWEKIVHPEDLEVNLLGWKHSLETGETHEVEIRLRGSNGFYRWHLMRAIPVRDADGEVVKWFGTGTDIDDQKHSQQKLEAQVQQRTTELLAANRRLQQEMEQKESAQKELNLQSEKLVRELTESSKRTSLLHSMGELLQSCRGMSEAVAIVTGFAPRIFQQLRGSLILLNPGRTDLEVAGSWSGCPTAAHTFEPEACWALRTGRIHRVEAGDVSARCPHAEGLETAYFCVPILAQGESIGIMHFQANDGNRVWFERQLTLPIAFTEQIGLSISNIRLREMLTEQSIKDPLTGVFNRRYLEDILPREVRRTQRAKQPIGVIMIDLDHFKKFNDDFGHSAGDPVLQEFGAVLRESVRSEDVICRYGGEEFVILLPGADENASRARAENIRLKLSALALVHQNRSLGTITISAGIAIAPVHAQDSAEVLAAADAALYRAKAAGRNCVMVAEKRSAAPKAGEARAASQSA
jgi:diguanylate cyclase (GGDEF)-like protein/PAS domain S-box-containing protein